MKVKRINASVNPNPQHTDKAVAALTATISGGADFNVPENAQEWIELLGDDKICTFVEAEYNRRAQAGLRNQLLDCVNEETGEFSPNQAKFQTFADNFRPDVSRRGTDSREKARQKAEAFFENASDEEFEAFLKKEAAKRGFTL